MERTSIILTPKQLAALRRIAQDTGLRFSEIVRRAVDLYLAHYRPEKS